MCCKVAFLAADPISKEAQAVLGVVTALYDSDREEPGRGLQLAMAREPIPPYVRWYFSLSYLLPMGRTRESLQQCMRGMEDDPLNFIGGFHYASALLARGSADAEETYLQQLSEFHSSHYQPYYLLALSQAIRGMHQKALTAAEKAHSLAPWSPTTGDFSRGS